MVDPAAVAPPKRARGRALALVGGGTMRRYRGANLDTISGVRRELARLYREARAGRIDPSDATRFAYVLLSIVKVAEAAEFDARLRQLEQRNAEPATDGAARAA